MGEHIGGQHFIGRQILGFNIGYEALHAVLAIKHHGFIKRFLSLK
jgi:hypothetical protein